MQRLRFLISVDGEDADYYHLGKVTSQHSRFQPFLRVSVYIWRSAKAPAGVEPFKVGVAIVNNKNRNVFRRHKLCIYKYM